MGKSTLIEEFFSGLNPRDVRVVRGVANPFDQDLPLGGIAELIAELLRLGSREDLRAVRANLETRVGALFAEKEPGERGALNHAIGAIFGLRYPGSSFDELSGGERRRRIAEALRALLFRFARKKPFVLSIDDAQYLDAMTLEFARELFDEAQGAPMCLIVALPPLRVRRGARSLGAPARRALRAHDRAR